MIRNLVIAVGAVLLICSAQSHAIDCRAYQVADLKIEGFLVDFDRKLKEDPKITRDGSIILSKKELWGILVEGMGEALDEYADEYVRIHFGGELPDGIAKERALIASLEYRDLCPGRTLWGISTLDTWLTYKSLCLHVWGGAFGTCGRTASEVAE